MTRRLRRRGEPDSQGLADERGITLIEIIMGVALVAIVGTVLTAILMNAWTTQRTVTAVTTATTKGNTMAAEIERALRNARDVQIADAGSTLRVHTTLSGERACQGFAIVDGALRFAQSDLLLPDRSSWPVWHEGISGIGTAPVFRAEGDAIAYGFDFSASDAAVVVQGLIAPRAPTGVSAPCW